MRFPFSGLRAGILTQLVFLIIAAMLLVNVAMLNFSQRDLLDAKIGTGRLLIKALEQNIQSFMQSGHRELNRINDAGDFGKWAEKLLSTGGYSGVVITDRNGSPVFTSILSGEGNQYGLTLAREAIGAGSLSVNYSGTAWGVLWLVKKNVHISAPLVVEGRRLGGIAVSSSLDSIYQTLRRSEKLIFLYILLDTIVLAMVGIYLLSRIVVKPIHRLLKMTEAYKGGDIIPSMAEDPRNEIGKLSRSLGIMIERLDENKRELEANISSLEKANRELKRAQNEIIRSEKLASVGRLAAGIAHEIGNPIGIILGYLEMIRKGDITEEEKVDFIKRVESEINRVRLIISQLLDYSRPSMGKREESHVHDLIIDTVNMLKPQPMMEGIEVRMDLGASLDTVLTDSNQLQQVFLNIIINAADVLRSGDQTAERDSRVVIIRSSDSDDCIEIRFSDNGPGIGPEELAYIFDPFYTTKEPGKGTGLGLSVCYRIVEGLGGTISAESVPGEGTTIIIRLPLC